jgi:DNA-binding response OmpR family regulator
MQNATILIVDDEKELANTLAETLRAHAREVLVAHNGQEAWDLLLSTKGRNVDLIVCDVSMPVLNGIEFFQRVRASGSLTPFLFLTAHAERALAMEKLKLGYCQTLQKPEGVRTLKAAIETALKTVRAGLRQAG